MSTSYFFQSIDAKLGGVPQKIKAIKAYCDTYIAENPPQIIMGDDGKATLDMSAPVPPDISVLIGEILYQLRSTLDHLAFHLVRLNRGGATLPVGWEDRCQFPLVLELKTADQVTQCLWGVLKTCPVFPKRRMHSLRVSSRTTKIGRLITLSDS